MRPDVFEMHDFYGTRQGQLARRLIARELRAQWPDLAGRHVLGLGHATPFMGALAMEAARAAVIMPRAQGVMRWPRKRPNLTALGQEDDLPIADRSMDRVLIVHALEASDRVGRMLREVWRILADDGEIVVVVPNRRGLWCLSDRTPFGQGRPYSSTQLKRLLRDHLFAPQKTGFALFVPPFRSNLLLKTAFAWERVGLRLAPRFAGALVMRAEKQITPAPIRPVEAGVKRPSYVQMPTPRPAIAAEQAGTSQRSVSPPARTTSSG